MEDFHRTKPSKVSLVGERYELGEEIGRGAFGQVFKATCVKDGSVVAIKQISLSGMSPDRLVDIMQEIDLLKKLNHENIVKYIESFKTRSHLHIVLEYMEQGALSQLKDKWGVLKEFLISAFISQVLHGLEYLHAQGVVHRDVKGANILLGAQGQVKLADFGVATQGDSSAPNADTDPVGTPYWMAPEVIEMTGSTAPSDIWSVACVVIELFTGSPPYFDLQPMSALYRIVQDAEVPLPEGSTKEMRAFLKRCFEKDPNDRPTAGELLKDPWLVGSQKTLKMSWNKAAGLAHRGLKQREAHRTLASVVQRMIDHSNSDAVSREGVLNDDSAEHYERPSSARNGSGAGAVPSMGMVAGDSRATSTASVGSAAGEGGLLGRKEIVNSMLPPLPPYRDDTAKGRSTLSMMPVEEGQEEGNSAAAEATLGLPGLPPAISAEGMPPEPERSPSPSGVITSPLFSANLPGRRSLAATLATSPAARLEAVLGDLGKRSQARLDLDATQSMTAAVGSVSLSTAGLGGHGVGTASSMPTNVHGNVYIPAAPAESPTESRPVSPGGSHISGLASASAGGPPVSVGLAYGVVAPASTAVSETDAGDVDEARQDMQELRKHLVVLHNVQNQGTGPSMCAACAAIQSLIQDKPEAKHWFLAKAGVVSIMEMLQQQDANLCAAALDLLLAVVAEDAPVLESLCLVGVVPIVNQLTAKNAPGGRPTRSRAASFVELLCSTSGHTVQMFVACGGLAVLVEMLDSGYLNDDYLVAVALDSIWAVMQVHGPTPLNHYCRLLCKADLAAQLLKCMRLMVTVARAGRGNHAMNITSRGQGYRPRTDMSISNSGAQGKDGAVEPTDMKRMEQAGNHLLSSCDLLLVLSHSDSVVKASTGRPENVQAMLALMEDVPSSLLLKLLQTVRNLSSDPQSMRQMQAAGAVQKLVSFIKKGASDSRVKLTPVLHLPLLEALYNLCKVAKERQAEASAAGICPVLTRLVVQRKSIAPAPSEFLSSMSLDSQVSTAVDNRTSVAIRAVCIRLLCILAHSNARTRDQLWMCQGVDIFMDLLCEPEWQRQALDALSVWLVEDTQRMEPKLMVKRNIGILVSMFREAPHKPLDRLLKPFKDMLTCSPKLCTHFSAQSELPAIMLAKLGNADAFLTTYILDIIQVMYNNHPRPKEFILKFQLSKHLEAVRSKHGVAIKVVDKCDVLQRAIQVNTVL